MLRRLLPGDFLGDPFEAARNVVLGAVLETNIGGVRTAGMITEAEVYIGGSDKASHTYGYRRTERVMSQYEMGGHAYVFLVYGIHAQFCVVLGERDVPNVVLVRSVMPLWGTDEMLRRRGKIKMDEGISSLGEKAKADGEMSALCGKTKPDDGMSSRRIKAKLDAALCAGPGNAAKALGITTRLNGVDLCTSDQIGLYVPAELKASSSEAGLYQFGESEMGSDEDISKRVNRSNAVMPCSDEMLRAIMSARADEIVEAPRVGIDYAEEYAAMRWRYYYRNNRFVSKKIKGVLRRSGAAYPAWSARSERRILNRILNSSEMGRAVDKYKYCDIILRRDDDINK